MLKLPTYASLISKSEAELDKELAPVYAEQVKAQADLERANLKAEIHADEAAVLKKLAGKTVNFKEVMSSLDNIALKERRLAQYDQIIGDLFPSRKSAVTTRVVKKAAVKGAKKGKKN